MVHNYTHIMMFGQNARLQRFTKIIFPLIGQIQNHEKTSKLAYITLRYVYIFKKFG